jgi:acyl dehydratase
MTGLAQRLDAEIGISRLSRSITISQSMVDQFAEVTFDRQFIHVDPERASETPFGGTIAHGFLLLALLSELLASLPDPISASVSINYGFERIRFITPVRTGSHIRGRFTLVDWQERRPGQFLVRYEVAIETEASEKPAATALWLIQLVA